MLQEVPRSRPARSALGGICLFGAGGGREARRPARHQQQSRRGLGRALGGLPPVNAPRPAGPLRARAAEAVPRGRVWWVRPAALGVPLPPWFRARRPPQAWAAEPARPEARQGGCKGKACWARGVPGPTPGLAPPGGPRVNVLPRLCSLHCECAGQACLTSFPTGSPGGHTDCPSTVSALPPTETRATF